MNLIIEAVSPFYSFLRFSGEDVYTFDAQVGGGLFLGRFPEAIELANQFKADETHLRQNLFELCHLQSACYSATPQADVFAGFPGKLRFGNDVGEQELPARL